MRTPMAQSSGRAGAEEPKERFDSPSFRDARGAFTYTAGQDTNGYYFDFRQPGTKQPVEGRRRIDYFVGSGSAARSYVLNVDGYLYEAPIAFYRKSESWNFAPGMESVPYPFLTRPIRPGCFLCHASRIQHLSGTDNAYASPPFLEGGVACERCHGPGSDHIASGKPMVNPAKLPAAERDSICEQCHLSGEIRVAKPGKDDQPLTAGDRLTNLLTTFVRAGSPSELRVTSHAENLAQSACKRASGEKLWCGTCHDPHTVPAANNKAVYFREKCLSCHETSSCMASRSSRQVNNDNCITCHMPRNPTADVEHVVFTDHSIRRHPTSAPAPSATAELVPYGGGSSTRDLALAYAIIGTREGNATYTERGFRLLQQAAANRTADAQALAYLAQFYRDRKDDAHAVPVYEQAWRMDPTQAPVAAALGAYRMQRGDYEGAIRFWNQALAINPALVLVRANLADALSRTGKPDEARAALRKALEFNPAFQPPKDLVERLRR